MSLVRFDPSIVTVNSRSLLVKLSVVQSLSSYSLVVRIGLNPSVTLLYGAGNC